MPRSRFKVEPAILHPPSQLELSLDNSKFCTYHSANPHIYEAFKKIALATIKKGFKHYSANGIFEIIRWKTGISADGDCFKVNNDYRAFYARLFAKHYPKYKDFFRTRTSKFDDK